ncbi:MAG: ribonuclease HII [Lachnospiraceae bacterium]|nr:ribonuclease HII [Lachnospiraceae bacterium]
MVAIQKIKEEFENTPIEQREGLFSRYQEDERKGVQSLLKKYRKAEKELASERARLEEMRIFERKYSAYSYICGIDEAGRGPLAGPVVAGACILPKDAEILYLNDSKQVSEKKRELLYDEITEKAIAWGVGIVSEKRIDEINILEATREAMRQAVERLSVKPDLLLVDAVHIPDIRAKQVGIIKGDERSVSIAAASILAKVTRDRMMAEYDEAFPEYGFAKHKGYGSAFHREKIMELGPCPIHRMTFLKNILQ